MVNQNCLKEQSFFDFFFMYFFFHWLGNGKYSAITTYMYIPMWVQWLWWLLCFFVQVPTSSVLFPELPASNVIVWQPWDWCIFLCLFVLWYFFFFVHFIYLFIFNQRLYFFLAGVKKHLKKWFPKGSKIKKSNKMDVIFTSDFITLLFIFRFLAIGLILKSRGTQNKVSVN